jgi:hypothetical protein
VFDRIDIHLRGPICSCDEQNIGWGITPGPGLELSCKTCGTKLSVPNKQFTARFVFADSEGVVLMPKASDEPDDEADGSDEEPDP